MRQARFGRRSEEVAPHVTGGKRMALPKPAPDDYLKPVPDAPTSQEAKPRSSASSRDRVIALLFEQIDIAAAAQMETAALRTELRPLILMATADLGMTLSASEQGVLEEDILNELTGLGPIEPFLADPTISDILINGPDMIFVERAGKLERVEGSFRDEAHVMKVAQRIASAVGRRVDQTTPLTDARLADGSRVNIVAKPVSLRGPTISIRKFAETPLKLDDLIGKACTESMAQTLRVAAAARFNILISGGTGSGKTTLLNALSALIDSGERIVTIEDAAELQLQQPHVVSLETRPASVEGTGRIDICDLVINALRMRPDRIILGEVRGPEAFQLMQAMNTGHDGTLATLHSSSPREALTRLEHMVLMANARLPRAALVRQIVRSVDMVVQVKRFACGTRRITAITEVTGLEGDLPLLQNLHEYEAREAADGTVSGRFVTTGVPPTLGRKARGFGLEADYLASARGGAAGAAL
ncbi:MAG: CpaF family protein [Pacificimonas sp.]